MPRVFKEQYKHGHREGQYKHSYQYIHRHSCLGEGVHRSIPKDARAR